MAKFTIHNNNGDFLGHSSSSKEKMIAQCKTMAVGTNVQEEYMAPSPWDKTKMTKHGKIVWNNFV